MTLSMAERGRLGGKRTAEKYGSDHFRQIGQKGFDALVLRLGDYGAAVSYLQKHHGMAKRPKSEWANGDRWRDHNHFPNPAGGS